MKFSAIKKRLLKLFLVLPVCLSLWTGPAEGEKIVELMKALNDIRAEQTEELEEEQSENPKK